MNKYKKIIEVTD